MAEEDLIFGKNRHFFGGIEPSNMKELKVSSHYDINDDSVVIKIKATLPTDTVVEGQTLCTVAGAVIRRSTEEYPEDEFSGDLVADIVEDGEIVDEEVEIGTTYYYAAFPYTKQGVYNRNKANRASVTARKYEYYFGYDLDTTDSNPATRVSYPSDVENTNYTPAVMDFTNNVFSYGDWPRSAGDKFMPRPCMLSSDGTVYEYLDPDDYAKNTDGRMSMVTMSDFSGNAMMEWPKIYTHREEVDGIYKFRCSDIKMGDDWDCWCNYDKNNNIIEHFYTAIYSGKSLNLVLRSLSGYGATGGHTTQLYTEQARANGDDWYISVLADHLLIQDLLVMMGKSTDTQETFGYGWCHKDNTSCMTSGTLNDKGLFWGGNDQKSAVKVFGMENYWGNINRRIAGWMQCGYNQKVKITRGTHDETTATDYNLTGDGYIQLDTKFIGYSNQISSDWISGMITQKWGRFPNNAGGSSTTYEADGLSLIQGDTYSLYSMIGGMWYNETRCGVFNANLYFTHDLEANYIGASLSCKPSV